MGRLASVACALALSACTRPPVVFGERAPAACAGHRINDDACVGWVLDRVLMGLAYRAYDDPEITAYVQAVGDRLVRAYGDRRRWTFRILDDEDPNAFSSLGTTVYLNRGILATLRDEAELAGVIGHEVGHVLGGHVHESFREAGKDVGRSPDSLARALRTSRDDEIQADELAVLLARRAGYDPRGVETMLRALAAIAPAGDPDDPHPQWPERIARVQALIAGHGGGVRDAAAYHRRMAALVVGEDPRVSSLVDGAAVFARAGFAVELPAHGRASAAHGVVGVVLDPATAIDLRLISAALVKVVAQQGDARTATETIVRGPIALAISVKGPRAAERARALRARVRAPSASELERLRPARVDLEAPRLLWTP